MSISTSRFCSRENNDVNIEAKFAGLEVGYDVPAIPGMSEDEIQTPCLILDLDALERNIRKMGDYAIEAFDP
jgi:3-hydroxy-D-aspartate aldolase